ncbi:MAG: hypothetical protein RDU01_00215 [Thermodesulfovibrionales bacterium]|nr:hypothetical protein [Thermodesulfovibrionales bacterium]
MYFFLLLKQLHPRYNVTHPGGFVDFDLAGKIVIVETEDGITYTGKLVEVGEEEVHLEGEMGWMVIPVERIADIREADALS